LLKQLKTRLRIQKPKSFLSQDTALRALLAQTTLEVLMMKRTPPNLWKLKPLLLLKVSKTQRHIALFN